MMVLGLGLVAGAVKLFVSSDAPKGATASAAAPATDPTPATPAPKAKSFASGTAMLTPTKPTGGAPTASSGIKPQNTLSDSRNTKPTAKARPAPKPSAALAGTLGPDHVDKGAGYAVRFPAGWTKRGLSGKGNWLAEATDGKSSSMAVGLGPDGGHGAADQQNLDALTKSFQANPNTTVEASGFGTIAGRKCMWHKLSVPSPAGTDGADTAAGRTTAVIYFAPLGDGRALKVRVVARPEKFAETAPTMKHSIDTLRLLDRQATAQ